MGDLRICHLLHDLALGGLETQVLRIIEATTASSVSFVVCYAGEDDAMAGAFRDAGAEVVYLDTGSARPIEQLRPMAVWRLARALSEEHVDVLHCHGSLYQLVIGRVAGRAVGCPVMGTYHNRQDVFHPATRVLERVTRPLSAVDVAVSKGVEGTFDGAPRVYEVGQPTLDRQTYTIYNGIDVEGFESRVRSADPSTVDDRRSSGGGVVFLTVGRYSAEKNQSTLVDAMRLAVSELQDPHLFLVGWGPLEAELREQVDQYGLEDHVTITGRVPSVEEYYALADVFVLPSYTEGLSVVLLEAMAAGLPIVASRIPGTTEAVIEGETGYLVPPDSAKKLAHAMARLGEADRRARFGRNGHAHVTETFDVRDTAAAYLDIYRRIV